MNATATHYSSTLLEGLFAVGDSVYVFNATIGRYVHGAVVASAELLYVHTDSGANVTASGDDTDNIYPDRVPPIQEVRIGTKVLVRWPLVADYFLNATVKDVNVSSLYPYKVQFTGGSFQWVELRNLRARQGKS